MLQWIGRAGLGIGVLALAVTAAPGEVVITEIMYNPASDERPPVRTEWVEIYNAGTEAVDLGGWYLADEDGKTEPLPPETLLDAGKVLVLIPGDTEGNLEAFHAAWGEDIRAVALPGWSRGGMSGLANRPTAENEILTLRDSGGTVHDEVNFQVGDPWPKPRQGPSIYLAPGSISTSANDDGANWRRSEFSLHGALNAKATDVFSDQDCGSPGTVAKE